MKQGGGFSRGAALNVRWGARFTPPKDKTTKIRLIPGAYTAFDGEEHEFFQYVSFYSARARRGFVSSAKWALQDGNVVKVSGDCLGYDEWQREIEKGTDRNDRSVSMRVMHVFTILHLDWFHEVPATDGAGRDKVYKKGKNEGKTIMDHIQCTGRRCEWCSGKYPKVFGKRSHWSMGVGHLTTLEGYVKEIGRDCQSCGGEGTVTEVSHDCSGCGKIVINLDDIDPKNENDMRAVSDALSGPYKCKCGTEDLLVTQLECSECQDPVSVSIFDCDLEIKSVGENTQSTVLIPRWTQTELSKDLAEIAKPFDFAAIFEGDPLDIQAEYLRVSNPYKGAAADKHSRGYDDPEDKKESKDEEDEAPSGRRERRGARSSTRERDRANYK